MEIETKLIAIIGDLSIPTIFFKLQEEISSSQNHWEFTDPESQV